MRTVTYTKDLYTYSELSEEAKEKVKQWYLDDEMRADFFHDDIVEELKMFFPYSSLRVEFSLSSCQGDGLNIFGDLNLFDFIDKWEATELYNEFVTQGMTEEEAYTEVYSIECNLDED